MQVHGLQKSYKQLHVLKGVDFEVARGSIFALLGSNGAGKTTTLRAITGAIRPRGGRVKFRGEDVTALAPHQKAARGFVLVPEGRQLFGEMSVEENLEMGAFSARGRKAFARNLERVLALFPRLADRLHQKAGTFSGGEQQMLAIARGLMSDPEILAIDELSLGLAPVVVQQLTAALNALKAAGTTLLLVEQNVHLALSVSDYAYVIAEGRSFMEGATRDIAGRPEIREAYLGL